MVVKRMVVFLCFILLQIGVVYVFLYYPHVTSIVRSGVDSVKLGTRAVQGETTMAVMSSTSLPDRRSLAERLYDTVRVLAFIMTIPENLERKARHARATWGWRMNKILVASDYENETFPTIPINVPHGRAYLATKSFATFDYIYANYFHDYDWFMKADDDTFVIPENLRFMLAGYNASEPLYFGNFFKVIIKQGYHSGGSGYVMSRETLRRFANRPAGLCYNKGSSDVHIGECMEKLNVTIMGTLDQKGRRRFHPLNVGAFIGGNLPAWFISYDKYNGKIKGVNGSSDYAVSFHYIKPSEMYQLEYLIYHLRPFGLLACDSERQLQQSIQHRIT